MRALKTLPRGTLQLMLSISWVNSSYRQITYDDQTQVIDKPHKTQPEVSILDLPTC